jgi:ATP-dependent DNA ligase
MIHPPYIEPMSHLFEVTLYQRGAKGETRVWTIYVSPSSENEDWAVITKAHGVLDGKMNTVHRTITTGKNIGKKNETTAHQQAVSEAQSQARKKMDEGYSEDIETRGDVPVILPMLAHDWNKVKRHPSVPLYAQPKLDGVRMIATRGHDGTIVLTTRKGKPIVSMTHIERELERIMPNGFVFDGELFSSERTFEEITGIVRRAVVREGEDNDPTVIEFHVFDVFQIGKEDASFEERAPMLVGYVGKARDGSGIRLVETVLLTTPAEIDSIHARFTVEGHEGTMYRTPRGRYTIRLRSNDLLKRKDFETEEYQIVDAVEADGKDKGTVIWIVEVSSGGARFNVRPRGTMEARREWWERREDYIGKMLTIRYQNLSEAGIPRFPVGIAIRDYE